MIFVTGDTHGYTDFGKLKTFAEHNPGLTKSDYMIIAGDFGGVWEASTLEKSLRHYTELPFCTLFVDGNHENFDLLEGYAVSQWKGGKVHIIKPDIIHLMRGQVYCIDGKTFFTFGGATSTDKWLRTPGLSWWHQEEPTYEEFEDALKSLAAVNNTVDYIITHACDGRALYYPPLRKNYKSATAYPENTMLSHFEETVQYKHWYFGHYHEDGEVTDKKTALYQKIIRIEP